MDDKTRMEYIEFRKNIDAQKGIVKQINDSKKITIGGSSKSKSSGGVLYVGEDETNE